MTNTALLSFSLWRKPASGFQASDTAAARMSPLASLVALAILLWSGAPAYAATHTANSCNAGDVQAKVNAARDGDVVIIPNGSCTWTASNSVTISGKGIHLRGATAAGVVITTAAGANTSILRITEDASHHVEISRLSFRETNNDFYVISVSGVANGKPVLIHDNSFGGYNGVRGIRFLVSRGVVYRNTTQAQTPTSVYNNRQFFSCKAFGGPPNAWTSPPVYGANDTTGTANIYVEDNQIVNVQESIDIDDNCRGVVRYNTFRDGHSGTHGADTSPYGMRHVEVYNNTFIRAGNTFINSWVGFRGGSGVVTDNVFPDLGSAGKAEITLRVLNLRRNDGPYPCWRNGWPAPHQVGQGHNGSTNVVEGIYIWNNTGTSDLTVWALNFEPDQCGGGADVSVHVRQGRDYFVGTPKPGYSKYRYPHPLRSSTGGTPDTDGGGGSVDFPGAPQNLRLISQ
jgi:hypothetical protein